MQIFRLVWAMLGLNQRPFALAPLDFFVRDVGIEPTTSAM